MAPPVPSPVPLPPPPALGSGRLDAEAVYTLRRGCQAAIVGAGHALAEADIAGAGDAGELSQGRFQLGLVVGGVELGGARRLGRPPAVAKLFSEACALALVPRSKPTTQVGTFLL